MSGDYTVGLAIHGPASSFTSTVLAAGVKALNAGRVASVSMATYDSSSIDPLKEEFGNRVKFVTCEDVGNPGFANINRQINLATAAIRSCAEDIVIKLRSDQVINFRRASKIIRKHLVELRSGKLLTTNCYTRRDRLYHPSDMFLVATRATFDEYYGTEFFSDTDLDCRMAVAADLRDGRPLIDTEIWPESRLFGRLLRSRGWDIRNDRDDSFNALHKNCIVIDARSIGLRWEKFLHGLFPLLPYKFEMAPFAGGPVERARCYRASKFGTCSSVYSSLTNLYAFMVWNSVFIDIRSCGGVAPYLRREMGRVRRHIFSR